MNSSITFRLAIILIISLAFTSCCKIGRKCGEQAYDPQIEDVRNCLLTAGNSLQFYYDDNQAYPDSFETLETQDYLMIDPVTRAKWEWKLTKTDTGHILISATSVKNSCCDKKTTVTFDYTTKEWVK